MYKYFGECQTLEEAKALYRRLALQHHPDRGGDLRTMQEINSEYARFQSEFSYRSERQRQTEAHSQGKKTAADYHNLDEVIETLRVKIEAALNLGLDVELCGLWVWVSGDTKPRREELKSLAFQWAPDKKMWYFAGVPSFNRVRRTMEEIRSMHGSTQFTHQQRQEKEEPARAGLHA
jgi:hypothetical protein